MASRSTEFYRKNKKAREKKNAYNRAYGASEKQKKRRAKRNAARKKLMKEGLVSKGDGKDVDHSDNNPHNNKKSNLKVMSKSKNRAKK